MTQKREKLLRILKDQIVIKFDKVVEDAILKLLPPFDEPQTYAYIYSLKGTHTPCVHNAVPEFHRSIKVEKFDKGKKVKFACFTRHEAEIAKNSINDKLGKYGYIAETQDNLVVFQTSMDTSAIPFLSNLGLNVLYCEHQGSIETIILADKNNNKPHNLISLIHKQEVDLQKKIQ